MLSTSVDNQECLGITQFLSLFLREIGTFIKTERKQVDIVSRTNVKLSKECRRTEIAIHLLVVQCHGRPRGLGQQTMSGSTCAGKILSLAQGCMDHSSTRYSILARQLSGIVVAVVGMYGVRGSRRNDQLRLSFHFPVH